MLLKRCGQNAGGVRSSPPMELHRKTHLPPRQLLAKHLRAERAARGISQEELAHRAGIDRAFVGSVERAERNVSIDSIEKLARALEVEISELFAPI